MPDTAATTKPLTATQASNLRKIVDNDYKALFSSLQDEIDTWYHVRRQAILDEFSDVRTTEIEDRAREFAQRIKDELETFRRNARESGYVPSDRYAFGVSLPTIFVPEAKKTQLENLDWQRTHLYQKIYRTIDDERRAAQRKILVASISNEDALSLIDATPKLSDLIADALNDLKPPAIEV